MPSVALVISFIGTMIVRAIAQTPLSLFVSLLVIWLNSAFQLGIGPAHAHDPSRPELNAWFKSLKNKAGAPCCDGGDGEHAQTDWDMGKRGYKVLLKNPQRPEEPGQWFNVPNDFVLKGPNLSGRATIWWWPSYEMDGTMTPNWRCFIPGPAG